MIKAKVENGIIDIVPFDQIDKATSEDINHIGVISNGIIYKLRNASDTKPGVYKRGLYSILINPTNDNIDDYKVKSENIINFDEAQNIRDVINKQTKLRELENATLTSANGNIFIPLSKENDTQEMIALKEAIRNKRININKYESRFGSNFNNDIRIFNKNSITLEKIKTICNALDIEVAMTFRDKAGDIPNPMGKSITTVVTTDQCDDSEESEE